MGTKRQRPASPKRQIRAKKNKSVKKNLDFFGGGESSIDTELLEVDVVNSQDTDCTETTRQLEGVRKQPQRHATTKKR